MIQIRALSKSYSLFDRTISVLQNIDLDIPSHTIFGIIGKSGAGKSTLLRCINCLEMPSSGHIWLRGHCVTTMHANQLRALRQKIGMVFQHFHLLRHRTVEANIALPLEIAKIAPARQKQKVQELLHLTELEPYAKQYPSQLSGGQKQRVAIARALANDPHLLLFDEATSALDPKTTQAILALLSKLQKALSLTIVLITHEMAVIKALCQEVAVLHEGRIIEQNNVLGLFTEPKMALTKTLVQEAWAEPTPATLKRWRAIPSSTHRQWIRIAYQGERASQPILSQLIQTYDITVNLLQGRLETIQDQTIGVMFVTLEGKPENIAQSVAFLKAQGLQVERLPDA